MASLNLPSHRLWEVWIVMVWVVWIVRTRSRTFLVLFFRRVGVLFLSRRTSRRRSSCRSPGVLVYGLLEWSSSCYWTSLLLVSCSHIRPILISLRLACTPIASAIHGRALFRGHRWRGVCRRASGWLVDEDGRRRVESLDWTCLDYYWAP